MRQGGEREGGGRSWRGSRALALRLLLDRGLSASPHPLFCPPLPRTWPASPAPSLLGCPFYSSVALCSNGRNFCPPPLSFPLPLSLPLSPSPSRAHRGPLGAHWWPGAGGVNWVQGSLHESAKMLSMFHGQQSWLHIGLLLGSPLESSWAFWASLMSSWAVLESADRLGMDFVDFLRDGSSRDWSLEDRGWRPSG